MPRFPFFPPTCPSPKCRSLASFGRRASHSRRWLRPRCASRFLGSHANHSHSQSSGFALSTTSASSSPQSATFPSGGIIFAPPSLPSAPPSLPSVSFSLPSTSPLPPGHTPVSSTHYSAHSTSHPAAQATYVYYPITSGGVAVGPIVAASVGSSVGVSLLAIAGVFLCFRRRRTERARVESALDTTRRCDALEAELRALRAQLARVEARQLLSSGGPPITYTNEKEADTLLDGNAKDGPPIYAD
ncbi:hypothetical protein C8F04DRAFT_1095364 [Mycena alexandri]|uniref:Uncharacterized protein n=1 Tax=Mycena alexandri TaxID=1745969 RepID=A0AAD6T0A1_9AGAR|nr:hypothetical protein C8F04DRAFT_1095364 [Mycena alexandri]